MNKKNLSTQRHSPDGFAPSSDIQPPSSYTKAHGYGQNLTNDEKFTQHRLPTIPEVAQLLAVPVSWVYSHTRGRAANRIPGIRLGKYWRFSKAEVIDWINRQGQ